MVRTDIEKQLFCTHWQLEKSEDSVGNCFIHFSSNTFSNEVHAGILRRLVKL